MESNFKPAKPDTIEMTLEVTMELRYWKKLSTQLSNVSYPSNQIDLAIRSMVSQAEAHFQPKKNES